MLTFPKGSNSVSHLTASRPPGWSQPTLSSQLLFPHLHDSSWFFQSRHPSSAPGLYFLLPTGHIQMEIWIHLKFNISKTRIHYFPLPDFHPPIQKLKSSQNSQSWLMVLPSTQWRWSQTLSATINSMARSIFDLDSTFWLPHPYSFLL